MQEQGQRVDHVTLPVWSHNDPYEFIRLHREALESDYVSEHLHQWIDLIFGCKQKGTEARLANNVFHHLTYEGAVDIDKIDDENQRRELLAFLQIGQTPSQLFNKPHVKRLSREDCPAPQLLAHCNREYLTRLIYVSPQTHRNKSSSQQTQRSHPHSRPRAEPAVVNIVNSADKLILIRADLSVDYYRWRYSSDINLHPFTVYYDKCK